MGGKKKAQKEVPVVKEEEEEVEETKGKQPSGKKAPPEPKKETKEVKKEEKETKEIKKEEKETKEKEVKKEEPKADEAGEEEEEEDPDAELKETAAGLDPTARRYLFALAALQKEIDEICLEETKEISRLEKKYEDILEPHYSRRRDIVCGVTEPSNDEISKGSKIVELPDENEKPKEEAKPAEGKAVKGQGIPGFWSTALQNAELDIIEDRDIEALQHLVNVSCKSCENPFEGFTLTFEFSENPFFTNTTLTKAYTTQLDGGDIVLQDTTGCTIDWKAGKNLTVVLKKKKQRHKGGGKTRTITKEEPCESFFRFFDFPKTLEEDDEEDEDDHNQMMMQDFEHGCTIRDRIIPRAVEWYTGHALQNMGLKISPDMLDFGGGDDDDEEGPPGQAGGQPECKQQ